MSSLSLKHPRQNELSFTAEDLRWATPEMVAKYRAKRLSSYGKVIADLGCGIGFQTFAFAERFEKVYAVEIDKEKLERAQANAEVLGLKNIIFIEGDALSKEVLQQLADVEIIFCDPERLPTEEERTLEKIKPEIAKLITLYSSLTQKIAIELPPQIKNLSLQGEKEYLSVGGKLNRLTLYLGELAQAERSAVILPQEARLEANVKAKLTFKNELGKYLYEVDPAVAKAGLLAELCRSIRMSVFSQEKNVFLSSGKEVKSPFLVHAFQVLGSCVFQEKEILALLKKAEAGKVTLRFSVDPQEYWNIRMKYEKQLSGTKKVSLFRFEREAVIGEELL